MKKSPKKTLDRLNKETDKIFSALEVIESAMLQRKGSGWSIIQVLGHLELAESASLAYMKKKLKAGSSMRKSSWLNKLRMRLVNVIQMTNLRWKAPSYVSSPPNDYNLAEIKEKWGKTRAALEQYIRYYPDELMNRLVYKHPMAGRQALNEAIRSFLYHQRHHKYQINRIRKELTI